MQQVQITFCFIIWYWSWCRGSYSLSICPLLQLIKHRHLSFCTGGSRHKLWLIITISIIVIVIILVSIPACKYTAIKKIYILEGIVITASSCYDTTLSSRSSHRYYGEDSLSNKRLSISNQSGPRRMRYDRGPRSLKGTLLPAPVYMCTFWSRVTGTLYSNVLL